MIFIITIEHSVLCWCKHVTGCADDLCHLVQELTVAAYTGDVVKTPLMPRVDLNKQTVGQFTHFMRRSNQVHKISKPWVHLDFKVI